MKTKPNIALQYETKHWTKSSLFRSVDNGIRGINVHGMVEPIKAIFCTQPWFKQVGTVFKSSFQQCVIQFFITSISSHLAFSIVALNMPLKPLFSTVTYRFCALTPSPEKNTTSREKINLILI